MRVKIMSPVVFFALVLLITNFSIIKSQEKMDLKSTLTTAEDESTSMTSFGNTFVQERDFRSVALFSDMIDTSTYKLNNISSDDLTEQRVNFFTLNDFMLNKNLMKTQMMTSTKMIQTNEISNVAVPRIKRSCDKEPWIKGDPSQIKKFVQMHAFIVRDEHIPDCGVAAKKITKTRYFMCSGVIISRNRILTSASCINSAEIDENHLDADLGVLIGALNEHSYIIRIARYEIHPEYIPDPRSNNYAKNNIAILDLSCPIPGRSIPIPKLPSQYYHDVGHMCCPDRCKLLTVVRFAKNYHIIQEMATKHLPRPTHDDDNKNLFKINPISANLEFINIKHGSLPVRSLKRKSREPGIAPIPQFFTQDMANKLKVKKIKNNKRKEFIAALRDSDGTVAEFDAEITSEANAVATTEGVTTEAIAESKNDIKNETGDGEPTSNSKQKNEDPTKSSSSNDMEWDVIRREILANNVTDLNRAKITNFGIAAMSEMMTKLLDAMTKHLTNTENIYNLFKGVLNESSPEDIEDYNKKISSFMGKHMLKYAVNELDQSEDSNSINSTDSLNSDCGNYTSSAIKKHIYCPPLGSPLIANNSLVALIAYTCDDTQNWVEWKYVEIIHNVDWIRKELRKKIIIENENEDAV